MDAAEDANLVAALVRGDRSAMDALYRQHHAEVFRFLFRLCGHRQEAEDLFQETWLSVARAAVRLTPGTRLLPWLYTVARNKHRDRHRFLVVDLRKRETVAVEPLEPTPSPADVMAARAWKDRVARAFAELGAAHREILLLCVVEGLDAPTVAGVLGVKEDAVRKRLSRARAVLAAALEKQQDREVHHAG